MVFRIYHLLLLLIMAAGPLAASQVPKKTIPKKIAPRKAVPQFMGPAEQIMLGAQRGDINLVKNAIVTHIFKHKNLPRELRLSAVHDDKGNTPFLIAAQTGNTLFLDYLLDFQYSLSKRPGIENTAGRETQQDLLSAHNNDNNNALHIVSEYHHHAFAQKIYHLNGELFDQLLIEQNKAQEIPLVIAARQGNLSLITFFFDNDIHQNLLALINRPQLEKAIQEAQQAGHADVVAYLTEKLQFVPQPDAPASHDDNQADAQSSHDAGNPAQAADDNNAVPNAEVSGAADVDESQHSVPSDNASPSTQQTSDAAASSIPAEQEVANQAGELQENEMQENNAQDELHNFADLLQQKWDNLDTIEQTITSIRNFIWESQNNNLLLVDILRKLDQAQDLLDQTTDLLNHVLLILARIEERTYSMNNLPPEFYNDFHIVQQRSALYINDINEIREFIAQSRQGINHNLDIIANHQDNADAEIDQEYGDLPISHDQQLIPRPQGQLAFADASDEGQNEHTIHTQNGDEQLLLNRFINATHALYNWLVGRPAPNQPTPALEYREQPVQNQNILQNQLIPVDQHQELAVPEDNQNQLIAPQQEEPPLILNRLRDALIWAYRRARDIEQPQAPALEYAQNGNVVPRDQQMRSEIYVDQDLSVAEINMHQAAEYARQAENSCKLADQNIICARRTFILEEARKYLQLAEYAAQSAQTYAREIQNILTTARQIDANKQQEYEHDKTELKQFIAQRVNYFARLTAHYAQTTLNAAQNAQRAVNKVRREMIYKEYTA